MQLNVMTTVVNVPRMESYKIERARVCRREIVYL